MSDEQKKTVREITYYFPDNRAGAAHPVASMSWMLDADDSYFPDNVADGGIMDDVIMQKGMTITVPRGWRWRTDRTKEKRTVQEIMVDKAEGRS